MRALLWIGLAVMAAGAAVLAWGVYLTADGGSATEVGPRVLAPARAATPDVGSATPTPPGTATPEVVPDIHVVVSGERMVDIAERLCGDWSVWQEFKRIARLPDGSLVESPVTEDIVAGEWVRPPRGCLSPADDAGVPVSTEHAAQADLADVASTAASDSHDAQPDARPAQRNDDLGAKPPWAVVRDIMLGIAASEAGPPLGVVVGLVIITFIFVRSRWVGIRFRWDEAAAARRRRAAAHARAAGGSVGVGLAEDVTPGQHSGEARATPTVGLELPGAARERGGDTAGSDVLPAREVVLEPQPVEPQPVEPQPVEPQPVEPQPVEPQPVEPQPVEPQPVEPQPVEPQPVEPQPVEPQPVEPQPVEPQPVEPQPVEPQPVEPQPVEPQPVEPQPVEPQPVEPQPVEPQPVEPQPVEPQPVEPQPVEPQPVEPQPVEPQPVEPQPVEPQPVEPQPVEPQPDVANDGEPVPIPDYTRDPFLGDPLFGVPAAKRPPRDEPTE